MLAALCFFARAASAQHETAPQVTAPAPETSQAASVTADVTVSDARMRAPDDGNWLLYGRTYDHQRFSPLTRDQPRQCEEAGAGRHHPDRHIGTAGSFARSS